MEKDFDRSLGATVHTSSSILVRAHGSANDDGRDRRVVVGATAPPPAARWSKRLETLQNFI